MPSLLGSESSAREEKSTSHRVKPESLGKTCKRSVGVQEARGPLGVTRIGITTVREFETSLTRNIFNQRHHAVFDDGSRICRLVGLTHVAFFADDLRSFVPARVNEGPAREEGVKSTRIETTADVSETLQLS